ncbi:unnamed protein product, partial [Allacma fusca]
IGSVILIVLTAVFLFVSPPLGQQNNDFVTIVTTIVTFILNILSFVMAIVLLHGSHKKKTFQLTAWMVYTVIGLVIWTIQTIAQCVTSPSPYSLVSNSISLAFVAFIEGFFLWVVGTHRKDIKATELCQCSVIKA